MKLLPLKCTKGYGGLALTQLKVEFSYERCPSITTKACAWKSFATGRQSELSTVLFSLAYWDFMHRNPEIMAFLYLRMQSKLPVVPF